MTPDPNLRLANPVKLRDVTWMMEALRARLIGLLQRRAKPELRDDGKAGLRRVLPSRGERTP